MPVAKLFIPIKLIDDNDDPSIPAIFALVGFGLFAASAYLWDQHWSLLFVFLIVVYLLATKTVLGKFVFYFLKCVMWFPIIAGMLFYHVCITIREIEWFTDDWDSIVVVEISSIILFDVQSSHSSSFDLG